MPLDSKVLTSLKPAASKLFFSSGILQFIGTTPRRKAAYCGVDEIPRLVQARISHSSRKPPLKKDHAVPS